MNSPMWTYVKAEISIRYLSSFVFPPLWERCLTIREAQLDRMVSNLLGYTYIWLPRAGITGSCVPFLPVGLEIWTWILMLLKQVLYPVSQLPSPIYSLLILFFYWCLQRDIELSWGEQVRSWQTALGASLFIIPSSLRLWTTLLGNFPRQWLSGAGCGLSQSLLHSQRNQEGQFGSYIFITQWPEPVTWAWLTAEQLENMAFEGKWVNWRYWEHHGTYHSHFHWKCWPQFL